MIEGTVTLEDHTISFTADGDTVNMTVTDTFADKREIMSVPLQAFFKALAIAVHPSGEPDAKADYPDAESIMGEIRWIP
jgi:hypothetical protein